VAYTFTRTMPQLVSLVLRKLGAIGVDQTPSAEDTAVVREAFDLRLKEMHALGVLWFNVAGATTDLVLVAGTASKSLSAVTDFLYPVTVKLRIGSDDRDVDIISHREYQAIESKSDSGEPSKVFFAPSGTAYFWPTPSGNYTVKLTYQAIAEDTTASGAPDIPVSMMRSLASVIAFDLVDEFDVDERRAQRIASGAREAIRILTNLNAERVDATPVKASYF
jgi:hypothetical protein